MAALAHDRELHAERVRRRAPDRLAPSAMLTEGTYTVLVRADRAPDAEIVARFGGIAIDDRTVAFRSATQAVECAIALAERAPGAIGLHAGEMGAGDQGEARPVVLAAGRATIAREGRVP